MVTYCIMCSTYNTRQTGDFFVDVLINRSFLYIGSFRVYKYSNNTDPLFMGL